MQRLIVLCDPRLPHGLPRSDINSFIIAHGSQCCIGNGSVQHHLAAHRRAAHSMPRRVRHTCDLPHDLACTSQARRTFNSLLWIPRLTLRAVKQSEATAACARWRWGWRL
jgi:hypothetical protein